MFASLVAKQASKKIADDFCIFNVYENKFFHIHTIFRDLRVSDGKKMMRHSCLFGPRYFVTNIGNAEFMQTMGYILHIIENSEYIVRLGYH